MVERARTPVAAVVICSFVLSVLKVDGRKLLGLWSDKWAERPVLALRSAVARQYLWGLIEESIVSAQLVEALEADMMCFLLVL